MRIEIINRQRKRRLSTSALARFIEKVARLVPPGEFDAVSVCIVSDVRMRELNRDFRRVNRSTDVLAFPTDGQQGPDGERYLGDIVISAETAERQAREQGHSLSRELKILALHGYLHLLGYDHERDRGVMSRLQDKVAAQLLGV